jgi:hypothetical protein
MSLTGLGQVGSELRTQIQFPGEEQVCVQGLKNLRHRFPASTDRMNQYRYDSYDEHFSSVKYITDVLSTESTLAGLSQSI